jgi:hypothetical protein
MGSLATILAMPSVACAKLNKNNKEMHDPELIVAQGYLCYVPGGDPTHRTVPAARPQNGTRSIRKRKEAQRSEYQWRTVSSLAM